VTWQGTADLTWTADIVQRVRAGDVDAFGQIVKGYERRVFALAVMILRNREGADDVTQDAFVRAFERLDLYDVRRPFYPWLATITMRLSRNWLARHSPGARRETPIQPESSAYASAAPAALDVLAAEDEGRHLWRLVERLPLGERTAVVLHYRQELSVSEVASAIGVTAGTVKTLLFRARQHLRASLAGATPSTIRSSR
jgi:RNA polymerase sigma-70 factor (ECF subfamily)